MQTSKWSWIRLLPSNPVDGSCKYIHKFKEDRQIGSDVLKKDYKASLSVVKTFEKLKARITDMAELIALGEEAADLDLQNELHTEIFSLKHDTYNVFKTLFLSGSIDSSFCTISVAAGAGGKESTDWVDMLIRMYENHIHRMGFSLNILESTKGEVGHKSIMLEVKGTGAYGWYKGENGVHRLIRISPFDTQKRRHTSFASVTVLPSSNEEESVQINAADLKIETFRASGKGGQHVNTTDSAVRITHRPTGLVASCQTDRSQHRNMRTAMKLLSAKLLEKKLNEKSDAKLAQYLSLPPNAWGSHIRTYVMSPYRLVKDLRTGHQTSKVEEVLAGGEELDAIMESWMMRTNT
ncbi:peptide chain release factor 2 [Paraphysoderma sedebokerense]|nr:peptide chain release factor 2 [Paraphysoderma sedebokerense]